MALAEKPYEEIVAGLRNLGYQGDLLSENYKFPDYFVPTKEERQVAAAAFGQTPISYESACIGIVRGNGFRGPSLVDRCRALGAPVILEIDNTQIREWEVSNAKGNHGLRGSYPTTHVRQLFADRASHWEPKYLLRAKNIGSVSGGRQLTLFAGLVAELEEHIQAQLEPLLLETLASTSSAYRSSAGHKPDATKLFKLVFWILTAKVFHDRGVKGFVSLQPEPDELLRVVAKQYQMPVPSLLNYESRQVAANLIWDKLDFRNLSVEVLSQIWSTTLVDAETRKRLGIHRTSRTLVRYITERIPFDAQGDDERIILEPCAGSAVFLIGAMNAIRPNLFGMTPARRHQYFKKHLAAVEHDPFGVEISRLALTLADFPNPNGWHIRRKDIFTPGKLAPELQRAGVVLCNPPFADFTPEERRRYHPVFVKKPAELLRIVLDDLHPRGVLGFVLPRNIVDGQGYASTRRRLAERFASLDITVLPDRAFEADAEVALLIATDPIPHNASRVSYHTVSDDAQAWQQFELRHEVSRTSDSELSIKDAEDTFAIPALREVWDYLINYPVLEDFAELHRGMQWTSALTDDEGETGNRALLVRDTPTKGYRLGVAPQTRFNMFEPIPKKYLTARPEDQSNNALRDYKWEKPKVILNKSAKSRGHWRIAASPDTEGLTFYQTFTGVWPRSDRYDVLLLSAILNSPVANAFIATREGKTDITIETLNSIPVPHFTDAQREQLRSLVGRYQKAAYFNLYSERPSDSPEFLLKQIDALVLSGYRMPPRVERQLLDFFRGHIRLVPHKFGDYIPADCEVYFPLSEYLSPEFQKATTGELLKRLENN